MTTTSKNLSGQESTFKPLEEPYNNLKESLKNYLTEKNEENLKIVEQKLDELGKRIFPT